MLLSINNIFFFLILLFSGTDKYGFHVLGMNIRFIYFAIFLFILINILNIKFYKLNIILLVIISHLTSIYSAKYPEYSLYYVFWIVVNYIFLLCVVQHVRTSKVSTIENTIITSFRVLSILIITTFIFGLFDFDPLGWTHPSDGGYARVELWHYEPSNLSVQMSMYLFYGFIYKLRRGKSFDILLSLLSLVLISSTTAYVSIIVFLIVTAFIPKLNIKTILYGVCLVFLVYILVPHSVEWYLGRLYFQDIDQASMGRISGLLQAISNHFMNPFLGNGAYALYNSGITPANITVELLISVGLFGTLTIYWFFGEIIFSKLFSSNLILKIMSWSGVCLLILLQSSQNYLRIYFWLYLAIILAYKLKYENVTKLA